MYRKIDELESILDKDEFAVVTLKMGGHAHIDAVDDSTAYAIDRLGHTYDINIEEVDIVYSHKAFIEKQENNER